MNRRLGFISSAQTGEWWLDYLAIYDGGAIFLPPVLQHEVQGNTLTLTWDYGALQQSKTLPGPSADWTDVPDATSPYLVPLSGGPAKKFYRVRATR